MWAQPCTYNIEARNEVVGNFLINMIPFVIESWDIQQGESVSQFQYVTDDFNEQSSEDIIKNGSLLQVSRRGVKIISSNSNHSNESVELELESPPTDNNKLKTKATSTIAFSFGSFLPSTTSFKSFSSFRHTSLRSVRSSSNSSEEKSKDSSTDSEEMSNKYEFTVKFRNGNTYMGTFDGINFSGYGIYRWSDGTSYEGYFLDNVMFGKGTMIWPDLSWYYGDFCYGYRHGYGSFNIAFTPTFYLGEWCWGKRHGTGWLQYSENVYYDGEWFTNFREGNGEFAYSNGCHYCGEWSRNKRQGFGTIYWSNNDWYRGSWYKGEMNDYGKYIWNATENINFSYPVENIYRGTWKNGDRDGFGKLEFGMINCAKYEGQFKLNLKHGNGKIICGNGLVIHGKPLFLYDKPIHLVDNDYLNAILEDSYSERSKSVEYKRVSNDRLYFQCPQTINIPIHTPMYEIDFTYHLKRAYKQLFSYMDQRQKTERNLKRHKVECYEKTIKKHLLVLYKLYGYYSCLGSIKITSTTPRIMMRLGLWQMYRDCYIVKEISLVRIDKLLASCDNIQLETVHNPFEKIFFWQFLHSLFTVAWTLYSSSLNDRDNIPDCIAYAFDRLLDVYIYPNAFRNDGFVFRYLDIAPITAMYRYYLCLGEPLPIRTFLAFMLAGDIKLGNIHNLSKNKINLMNYNGRNTVHFGSQIKYKPDETILIDLYKPLKTGQLYEDIFCEDFITLAMLQAISVEDFINIITHVCPLIEKKSYIVQMDYELTFLEYYEIILCCLHIYYDICKSAHISLTNSKNLL